jgi:hypothetical protein
VALRLDGGETAAARAIQDVVDGLNQLGPRREPTGAFRYIPSTEGGYTLFSNGAPRLGISADGTAVRFSSPHSPPTASQTFEYLRAIAPKVLFLQSKVVIHGAASRRGNGLRVISGESGAGKTTTARAFDAAGLPLFAEDMLVVASLQPLSVFEAGEEIIRAWARRGSDQLTRNPEDVVDAAALPSTIRGEQVPVREVWFIDRARRDPGRLDLSPRRLGETESALAMMSGLFLGGGSPEDWRQFLMLAGTVASTVAIFETLMPEGLDRLRAAAKRYSENSAS